MILPKLTYNNIFNRFGQVKMLLLSLVLVAIGSKAHAQEQDCEKFMKSITATFEAAQYDQVIAQLDTTKNFPTCSQLQRQQLYEILASAYLEIDNIEKGLEYIRKIFKLNPYYTTTDSKYSLDPFIANLKRYKVKPIIAFGFQGGFDVPVFITSHKYYVIQDSLISNKQSHNKPKLSFHVGLTLKYLINKNIYAAVEADYVDLTYERDIEATGSNPSYDNGFRNTKINFKENLRNVHFPIYAGYQLNLAKGHFVPSFYAGVYYNYLFHSTGTLNGTMQRFVGQNPYTDTSSTNFAAVDAPTKDTTTLNQRIQHQVGALAGIRLSYQKKFISVFLDMRYNFNIRKFEKPNTRYDNTLFTDYYYVDNDSRLTNVQVSVGFTYNIVHKIKKLY